jgi:hypothetical protein
MEPGKTCRCSPIQASFPCFGCVWAWSWSWNTPDGGVVGKEMPDLTVVPVSTVPALLDPSRRAQRAVGGSTRQATADGYIQ